MTSAAIQARWLNRIEQIESAAPDYDPWLQNAGAAGFFYQTGWLRRMQPLFEAHPDSEPRILLLFRQDKLLGAAHFHIIRKNWARGRLRVLQWMGTQDTSPPWMVLPGLLCDREAAPEERRALHDAMLEALIGIADDWDCATWTLMPEASPEVDALAGRGWRPVVEPEGIHRPVIDLGMGVDAYRQGLSSKTRRNLNKDRKDLAKAGHAQSFHFMRDLDETHLERFIEWHSRRQRSLRDKGRARLALFDRPIQGAVLRDLIRWAGQAGHALHGRLDIDGEPVAYLLNFVWGNEIIYFMTAFDEAWAHFHPGVNIFLETACEGATHYGLRRAHLLPGGNITKDRLANRREDLVRITAVNPFRMGARLRFALNRGARAVFRAIRPAEPR